MKILLSPGLSDGIPENPPIPTQDNEAPWGEFASTLGTVTPVALT
jgi:hypothetical protein